MRIKVDYIERVPTTTRELYYKALIVINVGISVKRFLVIIVSVSVVYLLQERKMMCALTTNASVVSGVQLRIHDC